MKMLFYTRSILPNMYHSLKQRPICQLMKRTFVVTPKLCTKKTHYDIVISGGGLVGATAAACLGSHDSLKDKSILLLEGSPEKDYNILPDVYSSRVVAISPATVDLMKSIGAWEHIINIRCQEVKKMQVWESCTDSLIGFDKDNLQENLAYIVENDVIMAAVTKQLQQLQDNVHVMYNSKVKQYILPSGDHKDRSPSKHTCQLHLEDGDEIDCKLVIGADGFKSLLRQTANIKTINWNYDQMAVVATLNLGEDIVNNVAWQRFLKTGPIAMLPVSPKNSCLIWTTSPSDARNLLQLSAESFVDAVNHAFWTEDSKDDYADSVLHRFDSILGSFGLGSKSQHQLPPTVLDIDDTSRAMFPLGLCHATQYVKPRMALIGDSAHRLHPLAGQGVNLGFGDVACLRDHLVSAVKLGSDIGGLTHLLKYESERQRHIVPVMATVDGLNRLYSTNNTALVLLRSLGLTATNALGPLKNQIIKGATT